MATTLLGVCRLLKGAAREREKLAIEVQRKRVTHEMSMNIMERHAKASEFILPHQVCDVDDCDNNAYEMRMIGPVPFAFCHECLGADSD